MVTKVYNLLKQINVPLDYNFRPDFDNKNIILSYHFFNETGILYGDGDIVEFGGSIQIDLFVKHRTNFTSVKAQILDIMLNDNFRLANISIEAEDVDGLGKIDHLIFIFNYMEKR